MDSQQEQNLEEINLSLQKKVDAQQLELQHKNRQLEIEAALEKVRVRATAMRISSELAETSAVLFQQLNELKIQAIRTGVGIFDDDNDAMELWLTTYSNSQEVMKILDYFNLHIHPVFENIIHARKQNKPYAITVLSGVEVRQYYQTMSTYLSLPQQHIYNDSEYFYFFFFSDGTISVITNQPLTEEECNIMIRLTLVFGLIYTRFIDLQKAEAQAKDVMKQTSLDRVRGQIASMRSTADLQRITPLIWNELTILGVPFIRCGVFIIDETVQNIQVYLSSPDGHSLAVLNLPFESTALAADIVAHWRKKIVYTANWTKEDFTNWTQSMLEYGQIQDVDSYEGTGGPPETLDLHFTPFTQGMLYIGNTDPLNDDEINLARSLTETFSIAYARYEDFIKLEKAKQDIELTLTQLKSTQTQLIQSEKMASLGELTAGIAHEIQNPLNFVNNFSEVNTELIDELKIELATGNTLQAIELANNIKENEQKINHHGKRADAIVKGMLQHSRSSSGVREPTDINALCDEYLRLSYHGLRAKDKNFNAKIETDFDPGAENINIIPQDIGRVLLNLFNNAFYAVSEKKKQDGEGYEPLVSAQTRRINSQLEITVIDNGNGIPQHMLNKIFQPFFTTKPTSKGTGLGLSISYDIIKAHGGELTINSHQDPLKGKRTMFIIHLPV